MIQFVFICNSCSYCLSTFWECRKALSLHWRHNERDGVSNHQPHDYLLNRLFRCRSKKTSKLRVTGLCEGNSPVAGKFPAQKASNTENVSTWWRLHIISANESIGSGTKYIRQHSVFCSPERQSINYCVRHKNLESVSEGIICQNIAWHE